MEKNLKDYVHFYIGCEVRIFNEVTNEYSRWRKMSFTDANLIANYNKKAQLKLINILDIDYYEYKELESIQGNTEISSHQGHVYSNPEKVRRYLLTTSAEKILEATKRSYDLFGLIESGLAIDKKILIK